MTYEIVKFTNSVNFQTIEKNWWANLKNVTSETNNYYYNKIFFKFLFLYHRSYRLTKHMNLKLF